MDKNKTTRAADNQALEQLGALHVEIAPPLFESVTIASTAVESRNVALASETSGRAERRRQVRLARKSMRGFGSVFRTKWRDKKSGEWRYSPRCTIKYYRNGEPIRESTSFINEADAWKLLKKRHSEIAAGRPVGPDVEKTTLEDMAVILKDDYKANKRKSIDRVEDALNHLRGFFGDARAKEITSDRVTAYIAARLAEKAAASTINYELAALGRMFTLAVRAGKAASKPFIPKLQLDNARKGFFERAQFDAALAHLPEGLTAALETAFTTGGVFRLRFLHARNTILI